MKEERLVSQRELDEHTGPKIAGWIALLIIIYLVLA